MQNQQSRQNPVIFNEQDIASITSLSSEKKHEAILQKFETGLRNSCPSNLDAKTWSALAGLKSGEHDRKQMMDTGYKPKAQRRLLDMGRYDIVWDASLPLLELPFDMCEYNLHKCGMPNTGNLLGAIPLTLEFITYYDKGLKNNVVHPVRDAAIRAGVDYTIDRLVGLNPVASFAINASGAVLAPACQYVADNFPKPDANALARLPAELREEIEDNYFEMVGNAAGMATLFSLPNTIKEKVGDAAVFVVDQASDEKNINRAKQVISNFVCAELAAAEPDTKGNYDAKMLKNIYYNSWSKLNLARSELPLFHLYGGQVLNNVLKNPQTLLKRRSVAEVKVPFQNPTSSSTIVTSSLTDEKNPGNEVKLAVQELQHSVAGHLSILDSKCAVLGAGLNQVLSEQIAAKKRTLAEDAIRQKEKSYQLTVENFQAGINGISLLAQVTGHNKFAARVSTIGNSAVNIANACRSIMNAASFALNPYVAIAQGCFAIFNCFAGGSDDGMQKALQGISQQIARLHQTVLDLHQENMRQFQEIRFSLQKIEYILSRGIAILRGEIKDVNAEVRKLSSFCNMAFYLLDRRLLSNQQQIMNAFATMKEGVALEQLMAYEAKMINPDFKANIWDFASDLKPIAIGVATSPFLTQSNISLEAYDKVLQCYSLQAKSNRLDVSKNIALITQAINLNQATMAVNPYMWLTASRMIMDLLTRREFRVDASHLGLVDSTFVAPLYEKGLWLRKALQMPEAKVLQNLIATVNTTANQVEKEIKKLMHQYEVNENDKSDGFKANLRSILAKDVEENNAAMFSESKSLEQQLTSLHDDLIRNTHADWKRQTEGSLRTRVAQLNNLINKVRINCFSSDSVYLDRAVMACFRPASTAMSFFIPSRNEAEPISSQSNSELFRLALRAESMGCGRIKMYYDIENPEEESKGHKHKHKHKDEKKHIASAKHIVGFKLCWHDHDEEKKESYDAVIGQMQSFTKDIYPKYDQDYKAYSLSYGIWYSPNLNGKDRQHGPNRPGMEEIKTFQEVKDSKAIQEHLRFIIDKKYTEVRLSINAKIQEDARSLQTPLGSAIQALLARSSVMFQALYFYIYDWLHQGVNLGVANVAANNLLQSLGCSLINFETLLASFTSYHGEASYTPIDYCGRVSNHCRQLSEAVPTMIINLTTKNIGGAVLYSSVEQMLGLLSDYRQSRLLLTSSSKKRKECVAESDDLQVEKKANNVEEKRDNQDVEREQRDSSASSSATASSTVPTISSNVQSIPLNNANVTTYPGVLIPSASFSSGTVMPATGTRQLMLFTNTFFGRPGVQTPLTTLTEPMQLASSPDSFFATSNSAISSSGSSSTATSTSNQTAQCSNSGTS
jgi:hypothetical protein